MVREMGKRISIPAKKLFFSISRSFFNLYSMIFLLSFPRLVDE